MICSFPVQSHEELENGLFCVRGSFHNCQLHWGTSSQFPIRLNFLNKVSLFRRKIVWFCGNSTFIAFSGICFFAFNWFRIFFFLRSLSQVLACYFLHFFPLVGRSLVESYTFSFHQAGRSSSYNPTSTFPWLSNFSSVEVYRIFSFSCGGCSSSKGIDLLPQH